MSTLALWFETLLQPWGKDLCCLKPVMLQECVGRHLILLVSPMKPEKDHHLFNSAYSNPVIFLQTKTAHTCLHVHGAWCIPDALELLCTCKLNFSVCAAKSVFKMCLTSSACANQLYSGPHMLQTSHAVPTHYSTSKHLRSGCMSWNCRHTDTQTLRNPWQVAKTQ